MRFVFGDCAIDPERRELSRGNAVVEVEPQVFDLLLLLIRRRDQVVSRDDLLDSVWNGRIVSESTVNSRIAAARRAIGDSGGEQQLIRTVARRGVRFVGDVREEPSNAGATAPDVVAARTPPPAAPAQEVTFCRTPDGVHLAVATIGDGPPLVKAANWLNHIEYDWASPIWSPLLVRLASDFRLIRYDERGNGLSDWEAADISFEAFVRDLETVVDALGLQRFALLGISQGAAVSVAYAVRHPERVSHLVLFGGYAVGWRKRGNATEITHREALHMLIPQGWGQDNPAFRQVFTSRMVPDGTREEMQWFNDLQRVTTSPESAVRLLNAVSGIDVVDLLPQVTVPTLVLHSRGDAWVPFEQGRMLAHGIPGARFVALDSRNHLVLSHEPAWHRFVDEVCDFLGAGAKARPSPHTPSGVA
jgi:DNA-binding winged helix-turn-helix (wHTH) protein/pimeloyl-ACP methyl ester carboxylesterase